MQQLYQLLLTQQETLPELTYSVVYRHSNGLDGLDNTFTNSTQISNHASIKCMAVSKYSIVFGGDFGIEHWGNSKFNIQMKVQAIQFSPDYEYIILQAKETMLFSTKTQNFVKAFPHDVKFDSTGSLCFCKGLVYETATFQQLKQFKCPEYGDFTISTQRDSLYLSSVTLIKHLEDLKDCQLIIDNYDTNKHFEHSIPPSNEVKQLWSDDGKILLIWSQTLDDHTNQSYFGTHHLNHWTEDKLQNIELFEGPIHDVQWVQNGFIVISGYMPAGAILFNKQGEKEYLIQYQAHINSIFPKNNLVALCGFGNLTGDIYIYEMDSLKKVGQTRQDKVVQFEWSPNGEHFLLATTFPRLRVDNQFIICSKYGELLRKEKFEELYEIKWVNDNNLNIQINIIEEVKQSKQINLTTGVDFIKQMKEAKVNDQPRKLQKDEKLSTLRSPPQNQQNVQLIQTAAPPKPAPQKQIFMRRQDPIIQQPTAEEIEQQHQQHLQQQQQMKLEKKQKQKQNKQMNHQNYKQKQKHLHQNDFQNEPNQDLGQNCYPMWHE